MLSSSSIPAWIFLLSLLQLLNAKSVRAAHPHLPRRRDDDDAGQYFDFFTRPDIQAPKWDITIHDRLALAPGYWMLAPYAMLDQREHDQLWVGPYIYDQDGELVWSGAPFFDYYNVYDFRVAQVGDEQMLTAIYQHGDGGVILNNNYRIERVVDWPIGEKILNMHGFHVVQNGQRALLMTKGHHNVPKEMTDAIDWEGDCFVHSHGLLEVDISKPRQSEILFKWNGTEHIGLDETTYGFAHLQKNCESGWDIHHFNAIDQFPDGDYLISARHTDGIYKISHEDGSIVWRLGGTKSDFTFKGNSEFSRQHHARVRSQSGTQVILSIFDNAKGDDKNPKSNEYSRGLILALDTQAMTVEILSEFAHPHKQIVPSRGSTQILPNENVFMSWTMGSLISEHAASGEILFEARLESGKNTYRAFKFPWVGRPIDPPDVYSIASESGFRGQSKSTKVYVSWNGATEVRKWRVYKTDAEGKQRSSIAEKVREGFETVLSASEYVQYIVAEALDDSNQPIGESKVIETIPSDALDQAFWYESHQWREKHGMPSPIHSTVTTADEEEKQEEEEEEGEEEDTPSSSILSTSTTSAFIAGMLSTITACAIFWLFWRYRRRGISRKGGPEYELVSPGRSSEDEK